MENQSNETKKPSEDKLSCTVYVQGVKKKCRKVENHSFKLGNLNLDVNPLEVEKLARQVIANNMKQLTKQTANVQMTL